MFSHLLSQHRYNLKRKIAELPPVSAEEFQKRINQQKAADEQERQDQALYCNACTNLYKSKNAHDAHLDSKKHKDNLKKYLEKNVQSELDAAPIVCVAGNTAQRREVVEDAEEVDSDEWADEDDTPNPMDTNECIFCTNKSEDFIENVRHMSVAHSFFIPDAEYCIDVEGLFRYLGDKVCRGTF
jgi:pre-60S factor REI1